MTSGTFVTWVVVGLLAGWLAGIVRKNRGQDQISDLLLGLSGSGAASWIVWALDLPGAPGTLTTASIAFLGAGVVLVGEHHHHSHHQKSLLPSPTHCYRSIFSWHRSCLGISTRCGEVGSGVDNPSEPA
jgi:uncharacterized membrane protein YeaQ/YmgE (transglycosylase-associated protein family)